MSTNDPRIRQLVESIRASIDEIETHLPAKLTTLRVRPGDDLNAAIAALDADGGIIVAQPGDYPDALVLRERRIGAPLITIATDSSTIPAAGARITRDALPGLARFATRARSTSTLTAQHRARNVAFIGVAWTGIPDMGRALVALGGDRSTLTRAADMAEGFVFDRCLFLGEPLRGQRRGIQLHARNVIVTGCGLYDFVEPGGDATPIGAWNGGHNVTIENSTLEGGGQSFYLGGSDSAAPDLMPRNWRVVRCTITKNRDWMNWPSYAALNIKALVEIKCGIGVVFDGCLVEHVWPKNWDGGGGFVFKCANQTGTAPWTETSDISVRNCIVRDCDRPFVFVGYGDDRKPTARMSNIELRNILAYDCRMTGMRAANPPDGLTVDHATILHGGGTFLEYWFDQAQPPGTALRWTNSVLTEGRYGVKGDGPLGRRGMAGLAQAFSTVEFTGNVLAGVGTDTYPGNVRVTPAQLAEGILPTFRARERFGVTTTDGRPPGVDVDALIAAGLVDALPS